MSNNELKCIPLQDKSSEITLIFRTIGSKDQKISVDINTLDSISQLKERLLAQLSTTESNIEAITNKDELDVKFFFKGRPIKDEDQISSLSLSNNDVILYMKISMKDTIKTAHNNDEEDSLDSLNTSVNVSDNNNNTSISSLNVLSHNYDNLRRVVNLINSTNLNADELQRGFNRFLLYGITLEELRTVRLFFHSGVLRYQLRNGINANWNREYIYQIEERWLNLEEANSNRMNSFRNMLSRDREMSDEQNSFIRGILLGILLGPLNLLLIAVFRRNYYFRKGLIFGMCLSTFAIVCFSLCK